VATIGVLFSDALFRPTETMASKTLCKWGAERLEQKFKKLREIVGRPRFVCRKCGRAAGGKKWLCSPTKLDGDGG